MGVRIRTLAKAALPPLVACAIIALALEGARLVLPADLHPGLMLAVLVPLGALTYIGVLVAFWRDVVRKSIAMLRR
ncbi:hypothetical protein [Erythrobacter mangrovi]|uniref:Uncharacterized protein n=1 Tax=Erythrobacter mangrovi TaxID=2739433 RepID=A0A7D4CL58_9SPHN|nr:hypothetical protein [Erythrobacter mangrovi]QKG70388.1 hypothetical protein HQR01_02850 [Erythrobacter mangrovi]